MKALKIVLAIMIVSMGLTVSSSCDMLKDKEVITGDDFTEFMEDEGFEVEDLTSEYEDEDGVEAVIIAYNDDYQIEFCVVESVSQAKNAYSQNKDDFEEQSSSSNVEVNVANYSKYSQKGGGTFSVVSRVENTFIYLVVDDKYQDDIEDYLKELGY